MVVLAITASVCLSVFVVPVSAISVDTASISSFFGGLTNALNDVDDIITSANDVMTAFYFPRIDVIDTGAEFQEIVDWYNNGGFLSQGQWNFLELLDASAQKAFIDDFRASNGIVAYPKSDPARNNIVRLYDGKLGCWVVDSEGNFPYVSKEAWYVYQGFNSDGTVTPSDDKLTAGSWVARDKVEAMKTIEVVSSSRLEEVAAALATKYPNQIALTLLTLKNTKYRVIRRYVDTDTQIRDYGYWSTARGLMVALAEPDKAAVNNPVVNNYNEGSVVIGEGGINVENQDFQIDNSTTEDNRLLVDLTNAVVNLITETGDRITQNIDNVTFDYSDHSYTVNTYDVTYNTTNNYYEYNYYTYNIQYTYNNTYVTYIGSTAEYQPKEYELYYELPDGRSSADLTEEDIAGLSFQFADVCNYKKSATDTSLRALYHFDGNVDDSSFWSTQGAFTWNTGASITYMESNAFNGALYLDEKTHEFVITLPSAIGSQDFSLQWRYYQTVATGATAGTTQHNDNYVMMDSTTLLGWSEQELYNGSGTKVGDLSIGTWQELALVRQSGNLYLYHNGVKLGSVSMSTVFNNKLTFHLGASSRAYSMIDELRVVNFAVTQKGAAYTPTAVPYDTNSILVLPDGAVPVADEYWQWDTTISPKRAIDLTVGYLDVESAPSSYSSATELQYGVFYVSDDKVSVYDGFTVFSGGSKTTAVSIYLTDEEEYGDPTLFYMSGSCVSCPLFITTNTAAIAENYTLTLVGPDLEQYSVSCSGLKRGLLASSTYDWGVLSLYCVQNFARPTKAQTSYPYTLFAVINVSPGKLVDAVYMELVAGNASNTGHKLVSAVYSSDELKSNTAAIQTDIPVKGYTVGGVRPTFPHRGDVWFPVEGSRICGVQVYNGQAWAETNARWWTGKRWIPIYAFDLVTLQDMWDVTGSDGEDVTPSIISEYGFWNWWKNQWTDFRAWLAVTLTPGSGPGGGSGGGSGSGEDSEPGFWDKIKDGFVNGLGNALQKLIEDVFNFITKVLELVLDLAYDLLEFFFTFLTDTVIGGITALFAAFTDGSLFEFFQETHTSVDAEGNPVETVTTRLPEGVAAVFAFFSGVVMILPAELRSVFIFGIAAIFLIAILKMVQS